MAQIVTSLPWLNNNQDPVATYQRSQQLVQQQQAQAARERQEQAELAQRAQEAAMQAQFQQRALALKEQEARSAVQVEADRLRQKGQALEFEQKAQEAEQRYLQAAPRLMDLGGGIRGVQYRGAYHPVRDPTVARVPQVRETEEEKAAIRERADVNRFQRSRLLNREKALQKLQPGTPGHDALPDEASQLSAVRQYIALQKELDALGKKGEKVTPSLASARNEATGVRVRRKSDGKILRYQGNRVDVPAGDFEILE
jgi:hypothetical protein